MEKIKLILVDDEVIYLKGLRALVEQYDNFEVVAEARNGQELLDIVSNHLPDVVLLDINMPVLDGIEAGIAMLKNYPNIKLIALSAYLKPIIKNKLKFMGFSGVIDKTTDFSVIANSINKVMET